jgi:predicted HicB family RNase H-like nuclease
MKDEYDFSLGERGKFFKPDARLNLPVYLDEEVSTYLRKQAEAKGKELNEIVNEMLEKHIDLIKTAK